MFPKHGIRKQGGLFGDGAGAAVVGEVSEGFGLLSSSVGSDGSGLEYMREDSNHRPSMDGEAIFQFASTYIPVIVKNALLKADLTLDELIILYLTKQICALLKKRYITLISQLRRLPPMLSSTLETPLQQVLHSLLLMK